MERIKTILPKEIDARTSQATCAVFSGAENLLDETDGDIDELLGIEEEICSRKHEFSTMDHLIVKAAVSKARVFSIPDPVHVELVVPMYHEILRMSPRINSRHSIYKNNMTPHQNGEDSLLRKYIEMEWLAHGTQLTYNLIFVDDMCDQDSGKAAQKLINENGLSNAQVLFLKDAVDNTLPGTLHYDAIENIIKGRESIRGGALCLGFAEAVTHVKQKNRIGNQIVGYVDSDSSYSLTQLGIPLWEISESGVLAVTASRQHELTYMEPAKRESQTSQRSPGLIRLKQVVGYLRSGVLGPQVPADTQSGFKLIKPEVLEMTLKQPDKAHNFSYDTQLLSRISRLTDDKEPIKTFGVVCIDSDELSTANNGVTYFYALQIISTIAEEIGFNEEGDEMWLLDYLTADVENYKMVKRLLDDSTDPAEWFPVGSPQAGLILDTRQKIETNKDTTAVGAYFTPQIITDLTSVLRQIEALKK